MTKVTFNNKQSPFFRSLKAKVDTYISDNKLQARGSRKLQLKGMIQAFSAIALYVTLVFFTPPLLFAVPLAGLLGFNLALIGFNIMHEGAHQSFSTKNWLNSISAYSLNVMGGTSYFWKVKHNVNHHTYTNIDGMDDDINIGPLMRLHDEQPHRPYHRFQHFYFIVLYSVSYLAWVFFHDFQKYFTRKIIRNEAPRKLAAREHLIFWISKVTFAIFFLLIPILMLGVGKALIGFLIMTVTCGIAISIVFQLAHVVEGTEFPKPAEGTNRIDREWAVHQVHTTANFATDNKLVSWLLGGLNFQVEHHLFPRISHVHYPHINRLLKETCLEHGVNYLEFPSVTSAVKAHLQHIRRLGQVQALQPAYATSGK